MVAGKLLRRVGLHPGQELVMMHLWELGPQRQVDLIGLLDSDAATMTRTVRRLEHAGFVRRVPLADDKRAFLIEPTAASRALRNQVERIWTQLEQITVGSVNEHQRQTILRVLEGLEARLTRAAVDSSP
jgi:MarR family transcriptional regulator, organic hydroperoxide resistance regulator